MMYQRGHPQRDVRLAHQWEIDRQHPWRLKIATRFGWVLSLLTPDPQIHMVSLTNTKLWMDKLNYFDGTIVWGTWPLASSSSWLLWEKSPNTLPRLLHQLVRVASIVQGRRFHSAPRSSRKTKTTHLTSLKQWCLANMSPSINWSAPS